jgi:hypothetical protein
MQQGWTWLECIIANRVWLDYNGVPGQSVSVPTEYGLTITVNLVRVYHCQQSQVHRYSQAILCWYWYTLARYTVIVKSYSVGNDTL